MRHRHAFIVAILLILTGCSGSSNPVLLDTTSGEDTAGGEDIADGDGTPGDTIVAPDSEEDVQLPCGCQSDAECLPANPEACVEWRCIEGADGCGFCGQAPLDCDDGEGCTVDSCDPGTGDCVHVSLGEGEGCDDGDPCTLADACDVDGHCAGLPVDCDDLNGCTLDTCDPGTGECSHVNVAVPCDDGDVCTEGDTCAGGTCQPGSVAKDCDDDDPCTDDACDPETGECVYAPAFGPGCCETDGDCDDGDVCTTDQCVPGEGCVFLPVPTPGCCNIAADCDDGDDCTDDSCHENLCSHLPSGGPGCCVPDCDGKECGPDGCGFSCGQCGVGFCEGGQCLTVCTPVCPAGVQCGPDGCGGSCGACSVGQTCGPMGLCAPCVPQCGNAECGIDGCGGICGLCPGGEVCSEAGLCGSGCDCVGAACLGDGFEGAVPEDDGTLAGWDWEGDAQVIGHLGAAGAPEGARMAMVSTGLFVEENGAIWTAFCPPAGPTTLEFSWRFYSEEFLEWCGSSFQDQFEVTVLAGDAVAAVFTVSVPDLCPPGECAGCGGMYVGLEAADVAFDVGGVFATPWQEASIPLDAAFSGGSGVTVRFDVTDVGDGIYDTAVLVDDVRLVSAAPCGGAADCDDGDPCTDDTCDVMTGLCAHGMVPGCCGTPGCCQQDADCADDDPCTDDVCFFEQCFNTPNGNPGCCDDQVLLDEDFDDGAAQGWTLEPEGQPFPGMGWMISTPGHTAPNALQCAAFPFFPGMESTASTPALALPAASSVTLDFWYRGLSAENQCPGGALTVLVGNAVVFSDCQTSSAWLHATVDLTEMAPGTIVLAFTPGGGGGLMPVATYAIDDVVVQTTCEVPLPGP